MYFDSLKPLILKETEDYIFINKPPFISTLADRNDLITILSLVKDYLPDAQICHRLDKETSGVLLIAKNAEAYRNASIQFEKRTTLKKYHAIADGIHDFKNEIVDLPLHITSSGYVKISHKKGKEAKTSFNTLEAYKRHTLVECTPETGRMHQIRVHLASLNASITGDDAYGGKPLLLSNLKSKYHLAKGKEELPIIKRFALHARFLSILDLNEAPLSCEAPYPKDFEVAIKQLTKNRN
jgi:23S rRNA pseudouridine955/2504/2580 synthase